MFIFTQAAMKLKVTKDRIKQPNNRDDKARSKTAGDWPLRDPMYCRICVTEPRVSRGTCMPFPAAILLVSDLQDTCLV